MAQIDTSEVMAMDAMIGRDEIVQINVRAIWDPLARHFKVTVTDELTGTDASRNTTDGMDKDGRIPSSSIISLVPQMIEEIIIVNRLMGPSSW
jgi:hypothetical protein